MYKVVNTSSFKQISALNSLVYTISLFTSKCRRERVTSKINNLRLAVQGINN
jgi:hypothetical protein